MEKTHGIVVGNGSTKRFEVLLRRIRHFSIISDKVSRIIHLCKEVLWIKYDGLMSIHKSD